jgi:PleD family two-component response regulator
MADPALRTLIAAPNGVVQTLAHALQELGVEVRAGVTPHGAASHLDAELDLILVCYVFDDLHPYRFVNRIRNDSPHKETPLILVRALPVPLGESQEAEIRRSYKSIGVNEFVNYSQLAHDNGPAHAGRVLRECVSQLVWLRRGMASARGNPNRPAA